MLVKNLFLWGLVMLGGAALSAQSERFAITLTGGWQPGEAPQRQAGYGTAVALEYHHPLSESAYLIGLLGLQAEHHRFYREVRTRGRFAGPPPHPRVAATEYRLRSMYLTTGLGVGLRRGRITIEGLLQPNILASSWLNTRRTTQTSGGRILTDRTDRDVQRHYGALPQTYIGTYHSLVRVAVTATGRLFYGLGPRIAVGASFARDLRQRQFVESSDFTCPPEQACILIGTFRHEFDLAKNAYRLHFRFRL